MRYDIKSRERYYSGKNIIKTRVIKYKLICYEFMK